MQIVTIHSGHKRKLRYRSNQEKSLQITARPYRRTNMTTIPLQTFARALGHYSTYADDGGKACNKISLCELRLSDETDRIFGILSLVTTLSFHNKPRLGTAPLVIDLGTSFSI